MRYFIILLLSCLFGGLSIYAICYVIEFLSNPKSIYIMESYLSFPLAVGILVATGTIYPTLCGIILSFGKIFDLLSDIFNKKRQNKKVND